MAALDDDVDTRVEFEDGMLYPGDAITYRGAPDEFGDDRVDCDIVVSVSHTYGGLFDVTTFDGRLWQGTRSRAEFNGLAARKFALPRR